MIDVNGPQAQYDAEEKALRKNMKSRQKNFLISTKIQVNLKN